MRSSFDAYRAERKDRDRPFATTKETRDTVAQNQEISAIRYFAGRMAAGFMSHRVEENEESNSDGRTQ